MTAAVVDRMLGERLSPSQVNTFLSCPAKWYFRYALGLAEPPTGTLALGTAFHSVLAANFRQRSKPNRTFPPRNSKSRLAKRSRWRPMMLNFREDEEPAVLIETGRALVRRYMVDARHGFSPRRSSCPSKP